MRVRPALLASVLGLFVATSVPAQIRPASQWALGLGMSVLAPRGGTSSATTGLGVMGSYARMVTPRLGFEVEGRALLASSASSSIPSCVPLPGVACEEQTLMPSEVLGFDARLAVSPTPRWRFSAGPSLGWAPSAVGARSDPVAGVTAGIGVSPFSADGKGLGLELRGTRFFSPLAEVNWVIGTGFSYRF